MTAQARPSSATVAIWILAIIGTLWFLRTARALLIPIALAALISYALEPLVSWLARRRVPRLLGTGLVMLVGLGLVAGGAYALRDDVMQVVKTLPETLERVREMVLSELGSNSKAVEQATDALGTGGGAAPSISSLVGMAGHVFIIFFLIFFILNSGHHVRDRLFEVAGRDDERRRNMAVIIADINMQIQRYLMVLLVTAVMVGAATWAMLAWQNVQHAAMWGILAGVFNSIPYFGPVIVSGGLFVVGFAQGGGLSQALQISGAALVITSLEGWLITPMLMGKAERMSALAVFLGLLLWTWLWGEWGTILAVPMLAVIKSVADHVDRLKPVGRMLAR